MEYLKSVTSELVPFLVQRKCDDMPSNRQKEFCLMHTKWKTNHPLLVYYLDMASLFVPGCMVLLKMNIHKILSCWSLCIWSIPMKMVYFLHANVYGFSKLDNRIKSLKCGIQFQIYCRFSFAVQCFCYQIQLIINCRYVQICALA